jgi:pimeloyl-ACP methyl ester carboxylesterase
MAAIRHTLPPARWWLRRIPIMVLAGVLIAAGLDFARGGVTAIWLRYAGAAAYGAPGERFEIAPGHALYIDCRGSGSPTIVLEAGMSADSATWSPIHDELARTPDLRLRPDRPGRSDDGSAGDLAARCRTSSRRCWSRPASHRYIVVGHSLGSVIGRVHAALHPNDVAGLVLVDGFDPDIFDERVVPLLGPIRDEYVGQTAGLWDFIGSVEGIDVEASRDQLAASVVAGLPIAVIVAPRIDARLDAATNQAILDSIAAGYDALSPGNVTFTLAWGSGHLVQFDQPAVIVAAVRRIVETVRR